MPNDEWLADNKLIGSCPYCGLRIFSDDFKRIEVIEPDKEELIYRCIHCGHEVNKENIIPF
jgi:DNA-directed RNA polymerase subunit RPC12/RpoP